MSERSVITLRIYVAAAFAERGHVRRFHEQLRARGHLPTGTWCELPGDGAEPRRTVDEYRAQAETNDRELLGSDLVILFAIGGREALCEARIAIANDIAVLWIGAPCLSAYRRGVVRLPGDAPPAMILDEVARLVAVANQQEVWRRSDAVWWAANAEQRDGAALALSPTSTVPAPPPSDALLEKLPARSFDSSARLSSASLEDCDEDEIEEARVERVTTR